MRRLLILIGLCLLLPACPDGSDDDKKRKIQVIVKGLADPWGIAYLPGGDLVCVTYGDHFIEIVQSPGQPGQVVTSYGGKVVTPTSVAVSTSGNFVVPCDIPDVTDLLNAADVAGINVDNNSGLTAIVDPTGVTASGADTDPWYFVKSDTGDIVRLDYNVLGDSADNTITTIAAGVVTRILEAPTHLVYISPNVYVADTGGDRVVQVEVDASTGATTVIADATLGLDRPAGIGRTSAGTLLVGNFGDGLIFEIDTSGTLIRTIKTGVGKERLRAVAEDPTGEIIIAHGRALSTNGKISRVKNP